MIFPAVGLASTAVLALQDFRTRRVGVVPLLLLGLAGLAWKGFATSQSAWNELFANLVFLGMILGAVWIWFRWIKRRKVLDHLLGAGDIVLFFSLTPWFSPPAFLLFFNLSLLIPLGIHFLSPRTVPETETGGIPLAGWMGLSFLICFPISLILP